MKLKITVEQYKMIKEQVDALKFRKTKLRMSVNTLKQMLKS